MHCFFLHFIVAQQLRYSRVLNVVIVFPQLSIFVICLGHFFAHKSRGQVGIEHQLVVGNFSKLLDDLNKMMIFDINSSRVRNHNERRSKLPNLIQQKIFYDEPEEITFVIFNILFILQYFLEFFIEDAHSYWKHKYILVEIVVGLFIFSIV